MFDQMKVVWTQRREKPGLNASIHERVELNPIRVTEPEADPSVPHDMNAASVVESTSTWTAPHIFTCSQEEL